LTDAILESLSRGVERLVERANVRHIPWALFVSELIGTALLVLLGLSLVILMFGADSPLTRLIPNKELRSLITGFLFGTTGASIALSPIGKVSGAHINPAVTLAFRLMGKLDLRTTVGYIVAQLSGAVVGSLPLLLWGEMGKSIAFGATLPGSGYSFSTVLLGEVITTFTMVALLAVFLGFRKIRPFTPAICVTQIEPSLVWLLSQQCAELTGLVSEDAAVV
jgi:aquaporin Z